jgi:hypothetical protein
MRTRSKRRKKYRRRSDYAAVGADVADIAQDTDLRSLRGVSSTKDANESGDVSHKEDAYDRTGNCESALEEDEGVDVDRAAHE